MKMLLKNYILQKTAGPDGFSVVLFQSLKARSFHDILEQSKMKSY